MKDWRDSLGSKKKVVLIEKPTSSSKVRDGYWDNVCKLLFVEILQDLLKANDKLKSKKFKEMKK